MPKKHLGKVKRGRPLGYKLPRHAKPTIFQLSQTSLTKSVSAATFDHIVIVLSATVMLWSLANTTWYLSLGLHLIGFMTIASRQRGLECMTHEGSHENWSRSRRTNDFFVTWLAALPVFSTIAGFRETHLPHHNEFGTANDMDNIRYRFLGVDSIDRACRTAFAKAIFARLAAYNGTWLKSIRASLRNLLLSLGWHAVFVVLPLSIAFGFVRAALIWATYWFVPMVVLLPVMRFIGESEKHRYSGTASVFDATFSHIGLFQRFILHPHGDAYHLVHHLFPSIPHFNLRRAHQYLIEADPIVFGARNRYRKTIFQSPISSNEPSIANVTPSRIDHVSVPQTQADTRSVLNV